MEYQDFADSSVGILRDFGISDETTPALVPAPTDWLSGLAANVTRDSLSEPHVFYIAVTNGQNIRFNVVMHRTFECLPRATYARFMNM